MNKLWFIYEQYSFSLSESVFSLSSWHFLWNIWGLWCYTNMWLYHSFEYAKREKNLSLSTHPHADEKFYSPQNLPGASQQNSVVAFSYTTEIIQLVQHHSSLQSWFKKTLLTLFFKEIFTVAAELRVLVLTSSEVDARDWPHARSVDPSPARSCFFHHLSKMLQRCKAPEILCGLQISTCLSINITLAFVKWQQSLMLNLS